MNIRLNYLYRDGANYKNYHSEVFTNATNMPVPMILERIRSYLIEGEWFVAKEWNLKDLHSFKWDVDIDHNWHEFDCVEETGDEPTQIDILLFLKAIAAMP